MGLNIICELINSKRVIAHVGFLHIQKLLDFFNHSKINISVLVVKPMSSPKVLFDRYTRSWPTADAKLLEIETMRKWINECCNHREFKMKVNGEVLLKFDELSEKELKAFDDAFEKNFGLKIEPILKEQEEKASKDLASKIKLLCLAASKNNLFGMASLLKEGIDPNLPFQQGFTAMHYACKYGHVDAILLLEKFKGKMEVVNDKGKTPLQYLSEQSLSLYNLKKNQDKDQVKRMDDKFSEPKSEPTFLPSGTRSSGTPEALHSAQVLTRSLQAS